MIPRGLLLPSLAERRPKKERKITRLIRFVCSPGQRRVVRARASSVHRGSGAQVLRCSGADFVVHVVVDAAHETAE